MKNKNIGKRKTILVGLVGALLLLFLPAIIFRIYYNSDITEWSETASINQTYDYGIVFGAGTYYGRPNRILKDRLDTAGELYQDKKIQKVILSGTNIDGHEEVDVMYRYLIENYNVKISDITLDGFGLRTFDTCRRASEVYDIGEALLITSSYHLPRSIYLCESSGIISSGVGSSRNMYMNGTFYVFREILATHKALIDTLFRDPEYISERY